MLNWGATVAAAKSSNQVPITIATSAERTRPLLTDKASQIAIGFKGFHAMSEVLNRAYAEGSVMLSDPHYIESARATFARFLDPDGTFIELAGQCDAAEVPDGLGKYTCG